MSLTTAKVAEIVKKQYFFKLRANIDAFSSLVGIQLLACLFSLGGVGSSGSGGNGVSIIVKYYSADIVIVFTMIWSLVTAITITTKPYRYHDFTFVTNRMTSSYSNILFLLTASILGAVTAILSRYLILFIGSTFFHFELYGLAFQGKALIISLFASTLYIFFAGSIGYFIGTLAQVNKMLVIFIPGLVIGSLFIDGLMGNDPLLMRIFQFYLLESSIFIFIIKIIISTALFFITSMAILNDMEVKK